MEEGTRAIKNIFDKILNTSITVKESLDDSIREEFLTLVQNLKEAYALENNINETINISKVTQLFWEIIESNLNLIYGEEATSNIFNYIKSKKSKFKTEDSLWDTVKDLLEYPEIDL